MSRYCTIAKYKSYISSCKNLKNKLLNAELQELLTKQNNVEPARIVSQLKDKISVLSNQLHETGKILANKYDENRKKTPQIPPRSIRKEAQKLCASFAKQITQNRRIIFASAAVSSVSEPQAVPEAPKPVVDTPKTGVEANLDPIPEPPPIPDVPEGLGEVINQLNALGEPTFVSLGLGGWTPVGIVQTCMEHLHVSLGVEWWLAIVIGTLVIRICMFPLVIIAQRNAAKMNNYLPQMQVLQMKMTQARQSGNQLETARYSQEMMVFMKEKGLNPLKNMVVPLAQMPVFLSFFMGLRQMCNVPVESLQHGGLFWFTDLTLPDQYFLMPIITSATLWATIELGTDTAKLSAQNLSVMKYVLRALPVIILPFTVNFPGAILCYWLSSNVISLGQVAFLKIPTVRDYFGIEATVSHKKENLPIQPKGFREGLKESWTNVKLTKELEERRKLDEIIFQRAGKGPIQQTFKYDPTKQASPNVGAPMSAKKR